LQEGRAIGLQQGGLKKALIYAYPEVAFTSFATK